MQLNPFAQAARLRRRLYKYNVLKSRKLPVPVISVGNVSVGGTGKTPLVRSLCQEARLRGFRVLILTRGYRSKVENYDGGKWVRGEFNQEPLWKVAEEIGDEPSLLMDALPSCWIGVGAHRYEVARRFFHEESRQGKPPVDVVILEDGFQHLQLHRDLDLVLVDSSRSYGQDLRIMPFGRLREDWSSIREADALIYTRVSSAEGDLSRRQDIDALRDFERRRPKKVFKLSFESKIQGREPVSLEGEKIILAAGIGNPDSLERAMKKHAANIVGRVFFRDHHTYTRADYRRIVQEARSERAWIVSTLKDRVKLSYWTTKEDPWIWVDQEPCPDEEVGRLWDFIFQRLDIQR
jgi:tetraacyldisaccharide 4'-kinase